MFTSMKQHSLLDRIRSAGGARVVRAGLVLGLAGTAMAVAATGAVFSDTQSVGANVFTTGTVDLATTPTSALVTYSTMAPGHSAVGAITVQNSGSLAMRYAVTGTATNTDSKNLYSQLDLTIWDEAAESDAGTDCAATAPATVLYGPGDTGAVGSALALVGDTAQGAQTGDRTLTAATSEVLCFKVDLPLSTGNTYQNATTTVTFDFAAEQTANNA